MTNPNKAKGSGAERAVVDLLRETGWPYAERRIAGAVKDRGDIAGVPGVVIEVKNCARTDLAGWLAEAEAERVNDGADLAVVWHKRRGRANAADWFVTMDGATLVRLLAAAGYGSGTLGRLLPVEPASDDPHPDCRHELHGADGGACPGCGHDSHPIPAGPAPTSPEVAVLPRMPLADRAVA